MKYAILKVNKELTEFEKLMGLLSCKTEEEEKFRDDNDMIEMYDRDFMLEQIKKKIKRCIS